MKCTEGILFLELMFIFLLLMTYRYLVNKGPATKSCYELN